METRESPNSPSESFSKAIQYSREEALRLSHLEIDIDDLLLGLLHEKPSNAVTILSQLGHQVDSLRGQLEPLATVRTINDSQRADIMGVDLSDSSRKVLLTPAAEEVVKTAFSEATELGRKSPGTEDLLLSILLKENQVAHSLSEVGVTYKEVRAKALSL